MAEAARDACRIGRRSSAAQMVPAMARYGLVSLLALTAVLVLLSVVGVAVVAVMFVARVLLAMALQFLPLFLPGMLLLPVRPCRARQCGCR